ncbi:MAG: hypothetical protein IT384_31690 [Deltaproteobacteria bacterium]|nr:hypothetical protein [Deltaproteobacteria bacterium]
MRDLAKLISLGALVAACAACGSRDNNNNNNNNGTPDRATQMIGAAGGTVTTPKGAALTIPAGAVPDGTTFTIEEVTPNVPAASGKAVGPVYRFGPSGMTFTAPVTMTLPYDKSAIPSGGDEFRDLEVLTAPDGTDAYTSLGRAQVSASGIASAQTTHFSLCVVVYRAADGCSLDCVPNEVEGCGCTGNCGGAALGVTCAAGECTCRKDNVEMNVYSASCPPVQDPRFQAGLSDCRTGTQCGGQGQGCCGGACRNGLRCNNNQCGVSTCGSQGQGCCAGDACDSGLTCRSGTCGAGDCGAQGQACCSNNSCSSPGLACTTGTPAICQPCGAQGQQCCASGNCNSGFTCEAASRTCAPAQTTCGHYEEPCCGADTPEPYCTEGVCVQGGCRPGG